MFAAEKAPDTEPVADSTTAAGLSRTGRSWRMAVSVVVLSLLAYGSLWGNDDDFPFGPMRMYSTSTKPSGRVAITAVYGTTADGTEVEISADDLGMRGAELEGQISRFADHPDLLGALAETYHEHFPDRPPFVRLQILRNYTKLHNGRVVGVSRLTVATWTVR